MQGPDDQYASWQDVEHYLLPETPLSHNNEHGQDRVDALSKMIDRNLSVDNSPSFSANPRESNHTSSALPPAFTSPILSNGTDLAMKADESSSALSAHGIPPTVRPLINFVVWRTHQQESGKVSTDKYILVTNDPIIQRQASKFGVRVKMLSQLSNILAKEGVKPSISSKESVTNFTINNHVVEEDLSEEEDRVVFDPKKRPGSSRGARQSQQQHTNIIDPDHFGRDDNVNPAKQQPPNGPIKSHTARGGRGNYNNTRGNSRIYNSPPQQQSHLAASQAIQRGRGGNVINGRGTTSQHRGNPHAQAYIRGTSHMNTGRGTPVGTPTAPRGNGAFRGRGTNIQHTPRGNLTGQGRGQFIQKPIDPDSFARPSPFGRGRGRGASTHRLWEPTSSG